MQGFRVIARMQIPAAIALVVVVVAARMELLSLPADLVVALALAAGGIGLPRVSEVAVASGDHPTPE